MSFVQGGIEIFFKHAFFVAYLFTHHLQLISPINRTTTHVSSRPPIYLILYDINMGKFPLNNKDNHHVSLYGHEHGSEMTHHLSDATSQIDGLTFKSFFGPASMLATICCSLLQATEGQKTKAQRAYPY